MTMLVTLTSLSIRLRRPLLSKKWSTSELSPSLPKRGFHYTETDTDRPTLIRRLVARAPTKLIPYLELLRVDRPIGSYLLFWPCAWSVTLATQNGSLPSLTLLTLFGVGAFLMRGAGCIINDLWDRDLDKKVDRTRNRPLASGVIRPKEALLLLTCQLALSFLVLIQFRSLFAIGLGLLAVPLVVVYPGVKRVSYWPQFVLGLTFNWGALLGYAAVHGTLNLPIVLPLYLAGINWTLLYDTIYAHQDKKDDIQVGIKSTALRLGEYTKIWLAVFGGVTVVGITCAGYGAGLAWPFYVWMVLGVVHVVWQVTTLDIDNEKDCGKKFRSNKIFGGIVFVGMVLGKLLA